MVIAKKNSRSGFTLLEAALTVSILSIVALLGPRLLRLTETFFNQGLARAEVQRNLRAALDQMDRSLRQASASTVSIAQDSGELPLSRISFTMPDGTLVVYKLKGRKLQRLVGAQTAVLAENVEYLAFTYPRSDDDTVLSIAMTVDRRTYTGRTSVHGGLPNVRIMNP